MSKGNEFSLQVASDLAVGIMADIANYDAALRIQAVGSLRRHKAVVHDLEIMLIPSRLTDLLNVAYGSRFEECYLELVKKWRGKVEQAGPRKKKIILPNGLPLELHVSSFESWSVELAIRTGPAEFSHKCVMPRKHRGWLPSDCRVHDGWQVFRGSTVIPMASERDFLAFLGLGWVEPWDRTGDLVCGDSVQP